MRNAKEVFNAIEAWALVNQEVRAVILTSSRANPNAPTDLFSDYDIELLVSNRKKFLADEEWLSHFGIILASYREDQDEFSMCLILLSDYVRIDFKIYELAYFEKYKQQPRLPEHLDMGYIFLADKDGASSSFKFPSYTAYIISRPTENEFLSVVNEFWWDATYVAKSLWRDEIYYAKYMLDSVIRFSYLQKIIEWHIGLQHDWNISANKHGRFFKRYLDNKAWEELQTTFAGSDTESNWKALFATTKLFIELAKKIAEELDYCYPQKTDDDVTTYLTKIWKLDKGAIDMQ